MLYRVLMGVGLFVLGYYLGREVTRKIADDAQSTTSKRQTRKVSQSSAD